MKEYLEEVLALDEAYLTRAIAREVFGIDTLAPDTVNADGVITLWSSDEQERAVETGEYSRSMNVALGLFRAIHDQLSTSQRLRLTRTATTFLAYILNVSDRTPEVVLFLVLTTLTPLQVTQTFLAAWRYEVKHYGALRYLSERFLLDLE